MAMATVEGAGDDNNDEQFGLFLQLQQLNSSLQSLKNVINNSSIPKLEQINEKILSNPSDPTCYTQLHHERTLILQTLQKQQLRYFQTEQELNKLQLQYQQINKSTVKFKKALPCIMEEHDDESTCEMDQPDTESDDSFNTTPTPTNNDGIRTHICLYANEHNITNHIL